MAKLKNFQNRIDDLFVALQAAELAELEPENAPVQPPEPEAPCGTNGNGRKPYPPAPPEVQGENGHNGHPVIEHTSGNGRQRLGWEDYLNAIERSDRLGFSFDGGDVNPLESPNSRANGNGSSFGPVIEVPLQIGDEYLGALHLEGGERTWTQDDTGVLSAVAQQVMQHIENLRLLEQAEKYRADAEEATQRLTHAAWEEYLGSPNAPSRGYVYDDHRVLPLDRMPEQSFEAPVLTEELRLRNNVIGQLAVVQAQGDTQTAADLLAEIATRLSTHIENLRLLDETERSRQQLDKRAAELETVAKVSTTAASTLNPEVLLQSVVDLTRYSFHLYHVQIYLFDETTELLELKAGAGKTGASISAEKQFVSLHSNRYLVAQAARARQGLILDDVSQVPEYPFHPLLPDVRSQMAIPMVAGERLVGVFDVLANSAHRFSSEDKLTYTTLAAQVAVALRNAELYAEQLVTVERLRELDHLKSSFLANMSHELRTPLNSILGFTQVIMEGLDGPLTMDMESDLQLIEKNGRHLLNLINDVLDMAKIESGRISLSLEPVILTELLEDVLQSTSPLARERALYLKLENAALDKLTLSLDQMRMRQVLINLVGNAIKFTEEGGVTVRLVQNEQHVQIRIHDTGIGIPLDKLETIFEAFSQVDTSTTRKVSGTGLGLPISRKLVELHDGRLWAESTGVASEGSVLILELPAG